LTFEVRVLIMHTTHRPIIKIIYGKSFQNTSQIKKGVLTRTICPSIYKCDLALWDPGL